MKPRKFSVLFSPDLSLWKVADSREQVICSGVDVINCIDWIGPPREEPGNNPEWVKVKDLVNSDLRRILDKAISAPVEERKDLYGGIVVDVYIRTVAQCDPLLGTEQKAAGV